MAHLRSPCPEASISGRINGKSKRMAGACWPTLLSSRAHPRPKSIPSPLSPSLPSSTLVRGRHRIVAGGEESCRRPVLRRCASHELVSAGSVTLPACTALVSRWVGKGAASPRPRGPPPLHPVGLLCSGSGGHRTNLRMRSAQLSSRTTTTVGSSLSLVHPFPWLNRRPRAVGASQVVANRTVAPSAPPLHPALSRALV